MTRKTRLFISYKTGIDDGLSGTANAIRRHLEASGYDVWMDTTSLNAGDDWNKQIYESIPQSDVLLLLLTEAAAGSEWVRREVDVAKGAQVSILPVLIRGGFNVSEALDKFDLNRRQYANLREATDEEYKDLVQSIEKIKAVTRQRQEEWLNALRMGEDKPLFKKAVSPCSERYAAYRLREANLPIRVYLAGGDMTEMQGIDVLVNTENCYMQMARIFEGASLSSKLRLHGSLTRGGNVVEDTLQQELYEQITKSDDYQLPVATAHVVTTHAGHPRSKLAQSGARYVFHVGALQVQAYARKNATVPIENEGIRAAVFNCLDEVMAVNRKQGLISPPGTQRRAEEEAEQANYRPIESIIFPMFATGRGGREAEVRQVAREICFAVRDHLLNHQDVEDFRRLSAIHLCAYAQTDLHAVEEEMNDIFQRV